MRVLGASTAVLDDETRTTPKPGEAAQVTWSMAYPDATQDDSQLSSVFIVCTQPDQFSGGVPVCQELIDIASGGSIAEYVALTRGRDAPNCEQYPDRVYDFGPFRVVCVTGTPKLNVSVAPSFKATAKLMRGIICRSGTPQLDQNAPGGASCKPKGPAEVRESVQVYGTVPVQYSDEESNQNPSIDAAGFAFHDPPLPWAALPDDLAASLTDDTCLEEAKARRVMHSEGSEELITLTYEASQREIHDGKPERLEFSAYTTYGELSHRFAVFDATDEPPLKDTYTWQITEDQRSRLNGKSKRVRFFFTVMDHRGGYAVATRDVCIDRQ
jgi:hypothetical protein